MNLKNKLSFFIAVLSITDIACTKNELRLTQYDLPVDKAYVRFALFSPGTPSVMIKVNDVKINGATTSGSAGFFPSVINSPDYAAVTSNGTFRISLVNTGTANDSVLLFNGALSVESAKFYSVSLADTGIDRTLFAIQDILGPIADSGFVNTRMVNAMAKSEALNLIRIDSTSATVVERDTIARNIVFKSATPYINNRVSPKALPSPQTGSYSFLRFRVVTVTSGKTIGTATLPATTPGPNQRSMTFYAFGFSNGTGTYLPGVSSFIYNQ